MSATRRGAEFEREVLRDLEARGWICTRAAASKGIADVWAIRTALALVECKTNGRIDPDQWNALYLAATAAAALPILAVATSTAERRKGGARIRYHRLVGPKRGIRGATAPMIPWDPDEPPILHLN